VLEFIYNTLSVCSEKDFRMALVIKFPFFVLARFSGWLLPSCSTRSCTTRVCPASRETSA